MSKTLSIGAHDLLFAVEGSDGIATTIILRRPPGGGFEPLLALRRHLELPDVPAPEPKATAHVPTTRELWAMRDKRGRA